MSAKLRKSPHASTIFKAEGTHGFPTKPFISYFRQLNARLLVSYTGSNNNNNMIISLLILNNAIILLSNFFVPETFTSSHILPSLHMWSACIPLAKSGPANWWYTVDPWK